MMRYPYRCSKAACRKRVTLAKRKEEYLRVKTCPACKRDSLRLDMAHKLESRRNRCHCDAYHFPHRKGSSVFCMHSTRQPTEQDWLDFYGKAA